MHYISYYDGDSKYKRLYKAKSVIVTTMAIMKMRGSVTMTTITKDEGLCNYNGNYEDERL